MRAPPDSKKAGDKRHRERHRNGERNEVTELPLLPVTNGRHVGEEVLHPAE